MLRPRYWPLWISCIFLIVMVALSFTPLAWKIEGRPNESYPELFFLVYELPLALILLLESIIVARLGKHRGRLARPRSWLLWLGIGLTIGLAALPLIPQFWTTNPFGTAPYPFHLFVLPILVLIVGLGTLLAHRR